MADKNGIYLIKHNNLVEHGVGLAGGAYTAGVTSVCDYLKIENQEVRDLIIKSTVPGLKEVRQAVTELFDENMKQYEIIASGDEEIEGLDLLHVVDVLVSMWLNNLMTDEEYAVIMNRLHGNFK